MFKYHSIALRSFQAEIGYHHQYSKYHTAFMPTGGAYAEADGTFPSFISSVFTSPPGSTNMEFVLGFSSSSTSRYATTRLHLAHLRIDRFSKPSSRRTMVGLRSAARLCKIDGRHPASFPCGRGKTMA